MLLRLPSDSGYSLDLLPPVASAVQDLQDALKESSSRISKGKSREATPDFDLSPLANILHTLLIACWQSIWPLADDGTPSDPLSIFIMLRGMNEDGSFKEPKAITSPLAGIQYCMRLTFLKEITKLVSEQGITDMQACDVLEPWFTEKSIPCPFDSVRTLQHQASGIVYNTAGMVRLWWADSKKYESFIFDGQLINLSQLTEIFHAMEKEMVDLWEDKVLLGTGVSIDLVSPPKS